MLSAFVGASYIISCVLSICLLQNLRLSLTSILFSIDAPHPVIKEQEVQASTNDMVTLMCEAESMPEPHIRWFRRGAELEENTQKYFQTTFSDSETKRVSELMIMMIDKEDAGLYVCSASNKHGRNDAEVRLIGRKYD